MQLSPPKKVTKDLDEKRITWSIRRSSTEAPDHLVRSLVACALAQSKVIACVRKPPVVPTRFRFGLAGRLLREIMYFSDPSRRRRWQEPAVPLRYLHRLRSTLLALLP